MGMYITSGNERLELCYICCHICLVQLYSLTSDGEKLIAGTGEPIVQCLTQTIP